MIALGSEVGNLTRAASSSSLTSFLKSPFHCNHDEHIGQRDQHVLQDDQNVTTLQCVLVHIWSDAKSHWCICFTFLQCVFSPCGFKYSSTSKKRRMRMSPCRQSPHWSRSVQPPSPGSTRPPL